MAQPDGRRPARGLITAGVLVLGLLLGVGGSWLLFGRQAPAGLVTSPDDAGPLVELPTPSADGASEEATATATSGRPAEPAVARNATEAVEGFLAAEVAADFDRSFDYLTRADRKTYDGRAGWVAAHAEIPPVTGFEVGEVRRTDQGAEVDVELELESSLDEVAGLTPARALGTWPLRREQGGWRLLFGEGTLRPLFPDPAAATAAAQTWYEERQACGQAEEYDAGLRGDSFLAAELCDSPGQVTAGAPAPLTDPVDVQPFDTAFGGEAVAQMQVVEVDGPVPLRVVLAPVQDRWLVVGLLQSNTP